MKKVISFLLVAILALGCVYVPLSFLAKSANGNSYVSNSIKSETPVATANQLPQELLDSEYVTVYNSKEEYIAEQNKSEAQTKNLSANSADAEFKPVWQTIEVIGEKTGKPISGAIVLLDGTPRFTNAVGQISTRISKPNVELRVEKDGYNPYIEYYDVDEDVDKRTVLLKKANDDIEIYNVLFEYNGDMSNLLAQDFYFPLGEENYYSTLTINANTDADEYRLYANSKCVYKQSENTFEYLEYEKLFSAGDEISVQVVVKGIASEIIKLNLYISKELEKEELIDMSKDMSINMNLDEKGQKSRGLDTTFFGKFEFDFADLFAEIFNIFNKKNTEMNFIYNRKTGEIEFVVGYTVEREYSKQDKIKNEITKISEDKTISPAEKARMIKEKKKNLHQLDNEDYRKFGNTYNIVKKGLKNLKDGKPSDKRGVRDYIKTMANIKERKHEVKSKFITQAPQFNMSFDLLGCFKYSTKTKQFTDASLMTSIEGSVEFGGQIMLAFVPCFWEVEFGLKFGLKIRFLSTDENNNAAFVLNDLLVFSMEAFGRGEFGVGIRNLLGVSGYIKLNIGGELPLLDATNIKPIGGFKAAAKIQALFWQFEIQIANINFFSEKVSRMSIRSLNNVGLSDKQIASNVYQAAEPKIITMGNKTILTWIENNNSRDIYNAPTLMYAINDGSGWSMAKPIYDNGYASFSHDSYFDGKDLYVTWQGGNRFFIGDDTFETVAKSNEIYVAKYNSDKDCFENVERITNNDSMDTYPTFAENDAASDNLHIVWNRNSEANILGLTGTNSFVQSKLLNGRWTNEDVLISIDKPVSSAVSLCKDNKLISTYIVDEDGDLFTNDQNIYIYKDDIVTNFTDNASLYSSLQFIKDCGDYALVYEFEGSLYQTSNFKEINKVNNLVYNSVNNIKVLTDEATNNKIIYYTKCDNVSQLYCSIYDYNKKIWNEEVRLTNEKYDVVRPSILYSCGKIDMIYYLDDGENMAMCHNNISLKSDIKIENVYISDVVFTGKEFVVNIEVANIGHKLISGISIDINGVGSYIELDEPLKSGEMRYIRVLHSTNSRANELNIKVFLVENGINLAEDNYLFSIDNVDLAIDVEKTILYGKQKFDISLFNLGERNSESILNVYINGVVVDTINLDIIDKDMSLSYIFDSIEENDKIVFEVVSQKVDFDLSNNFITLFSTITENGMAETLSIENINLFLNVAKGILM